MSDLGNRMKAYERVWQQQFPPNTWLIARVDGRAFHTFTRKAQKPFDGSLCDLMVDAALLTAKDIAGFRLAYHQSDEVTFAFTDTADHNSQHFFGGKVQKLTSVIASTFTARFNECLSDLSWYSPYSVSAATFDCRVMMVPKPDVANMFVWRQQDWERNSISMLAQHHFSHKDLQGKSRSEMHEMLHSIGVNWAHLEDWEKNGTFILPTGNINREKLNYETIDHLLDIYNGDCKHE